MLTLAVDTSTDLGSVALGEDGRLRAETSLSIRADHSQTVLPEMTRLLERCGRSAAELDEVVVGAGPGSFTGVRIGASLAKGLCASTGADLYAYSSLAAVAAGTGLQGRLCVLLPAREDEVYAAAYRSLRPLEASVDVTVAPVREVMNGLGGPERWRFAGAGSLRHRELLERHGGHVLSPLHATPRAAALLVLRADEPRLGLVPDPMGWEPQYVRASGAERGV